VYSFCPVVPFIIEHMISMASKLKMASEPRLRSFHENLDVVNKVDTTLNFPSVKLFKNFGFLCQLEIKYTLLRLYFNGSAKKG